jgi:hypothetical protein
LLSAFTALIGAPLPTAANISLLMCTSGWLRTARGYAP